MADPFKAYDIRGIYPDQLDEALAHKIGNATAQVLGLAGKRFTVGRDMRVSGPMLKEAFIAGLVEAGVHVVDVGMQSTPATTFAMHELGTEGGAQITASHNPSEYGGIKITGPGFKPIGGGTGMEEIEAIARSGKTVPAAGGKITEAFVLDSYAEFLAQRLDLAKPLTIVVDGGNGIIGTMFQHLAPKLPGITIVPMYFDPDGRFPNHDANPLKTENLPDLQARVLAEGADFGAAFDGDGDRCALVDEKGQIITCDLTTALLGQYYLEREKGATIAYDLRSSKVVAEMITEMGGKPVETRVGHSFIKATLKAEKAPFAGELSGHYYFRDFFGADSGLYAFILLANVLSRVDSASSAIAPLQKYFHSGEINFKADKDAVFAKIKALPGAEITELDGITARFGTWWCNVRASNTEPVVRLNLEADTKAEMDAKLAEMKALIEG
ncbi:MAG: phosphomannomutase/phosphoglucomutase [Planctomycetota bacterium]|jgi:phosphomannomutase|nr:phosphomannomutase/phosphoglucomutase [Planctomycetota bacterium]